MSPLFHPTWLDCSWRRGLLSPDRRLPVGVGSSPLITERFWWKSCCEAVRRGLFQNCTVEYKSVSFEKGNLPSILSKALWIMHPLEIFGGINQFNFWLFWLLPWYSEKEKELCDCSWESDGWRTYSCKNCRTQPLFFSLSSCRREERAAAVLAGFFPALSLLLTVFFISRRSRFIPAWPCSKCT